MGASFSGGSQKAGVDHAERLEQATVEKLIERLA